MVNLRKIAGVAAALLVASATSAAAVTINVIQSGPNGPGIDAPGYGAILPPGATGIVPAGAATAGSTSGVCLSPFGGSAAGNSYFCATPPNPGNVGSPPTVTLSFAAPQSALTMLWGSIDTYNTLTFLTDGGDAVVVNGVDAAAAIDPAATPDGSNFNLAGIFRFAFDDGRTFQSVEFNTTVPAFEFAFVPLPAAALLILGGLGGLGLVARRRSAARTA